MVEIGIYSGEDYATRPERLRVLEHRFKRTKNPLYLWKIIRICLVDLDDQEQLPLDALIYLREVSGRLEKATRSGRVLGSDAAQQAAKALYLTSTQGQANCFTALTVDTADMNLARAAIADREGALEDAMKRLNIDEERARKRLYRGRRLLGLKPPPTKRLPTGRM